MDFVLARSTVTIAGFALRLVGDNVEIVGRETPPKELFERLKPSKEAIVEGLKANPPEIIQEPGFICPHCRGNKLEHHAIGLVCCACGKLAFVFHADNSIERVDYQEPKFM